jgi:WD40 repeat protein
VKLSRVARWSCLIAVFAAGLSCSEPTRPELGVVAVVTATHGLDPDSDGYAVVFDGATVDTAAAQDSVTRSGVAPGDHRVALEGLASNCAIVGENPQTVHVASGSVAAVHFEIECLATRAAIRIPLVPTGAARDTNGYLIVLDGAVLAALSFSADTSFRVPPGAHGLALRGIAPFWVSPDDSLRADTLAAGDTWTVTWSVHCLQPLANRIAYNSRGSIYTVRADGTDPRLFSPPICFCTGAAISRDGMRVAWWAQGIVWMYADSTGFRRLTDATASATRPAWSPDGRRIAYVEMINGATDTMEVFVMDADGSHRQRITHDSTFITDLAWSPDGSRIAYAGKGDPRSFLFHIWLMNPDGTGRMRLTSDDEHHNAPAWSPDGLRIAYSSRGPSGLPEIWVVPAAWGRSG